MAQKMEIQAWEADPYVSQWPEMRPFWEAANSGKFILPQCRQCNKYHWHPRAVCPFCRSDSIAWVEAKGRGAVYSYSVARTWSPQHVVAFVKLLEGPILLTQIVDCSPEEVHINLTVQVKLIAVDTGRSMPFFAPAP